MKEGDLDERWQDMSRHDIGDQFIETLTDGKRHMLKLVELHNYDKEACSGCDLYSAGPIQMRGDGNGHRYLVDFKTSKGIWDEYKYQLCAYMQAYNETESEKIENLAILHLDKETGEPTFKTIEKDIDRMTELFNSLCAVYYLMANRRLKNNPFVARAKGDILPF